MDKELEKIIDAIKDNKCLLVLGPEIGEISTNIFEGNTPKNFDDSIRLAYEYYVNNEIQDEDEKEEILSNPIRFIDNPFAKENFLTVSEAYEGHLYDFMKWYFEQLVGWKKPFTQIAEIPFSLILSLLPDEHLETTMQEVNKDAFVISHYSRLNKKVRSIDDVPEGKTILYKLLGTLSNKDSTFTFNDWFDFLHSIFKDNPKVPEVIINLIKEAQVIVFIGVRVEKWYVQMLINLLLHLGDVSSATDKLAFVNVKEENEDKLAKNRLKVSLKKNRLPIPLLQDIHDACKNENLLRTTSSKKIEKKIEAKVFISYNHNDSDIALQLKKDLETFGIEVIIDTDNPIGFEIPQFINESIQKADFTLQLISKDFLTSAWVAQESIRAFIAAEVAGKIVLPCEIDESLRDTNFRKTAMDKIDFQLEDLLSEIKKRQDKEEITIDLDYQRNRLLQLKNNYDTIVSEFNQKNRGDLRGNLYESGLQKIINSIRIYLSKVKK